MGLMKLLLTLLFLASCTTGPIVNCGSHDISSQYYCFPERNRAVR